MGENQVAERKILLTLINQMSDLPKTFRTDNLPLGMYMISYYS
jgi:hypothetical protein